MLQKTIAKAAIVLFLSINNSLATGGQTMTQVDIATEYYQALYSGEHNTVRNFASSDMVFEDPSAPPEFGIPSRFDELEAFLSFMKSSLQGKVEISFIDKYVSNDKVVLIVSTKGEIPASLARMGEKGMVEYSTRGVSVLHVVDGRVLRHTDYFDYPALANSFKKIESPNP